MRKKKQPKSNEAHIIGVNIQARQVLETLFKACGWNVVDHNNGNYAYPHKACLKAIRANTNAKKRKSK